MSLIRNSSIVISGIIISNLLAYVFHIYVARSLGPANYGTFGALMALFLLISLPAGAISSAITKFTAKYNSNKEYNKISYLRNHISNKLWLVGSLIFLFIVMLSQPIAKYLNITQPHQVMIVAFTLVFALILPINRGILQGMKKFKHYSFNIVLESLVRIFLAFILISIGLSVDGAILAYGLAYFLAFIAIFPFIKEINHDNSNDINNKINNKSNKINKLTNNSNNNSNFKDVYHFIALVLFVNILFQSILNLPALFIKHFFSSELTGFWTAALTLARVSLFVTGGIAIVMFPEVSGQKDHTIKRSILKKSLLLTLLASIAIAIVFFLIGKFAILILYGQAYLPSVPILYWLGLAMIPLSLLQSWMNYWLAK